MALLPVVQNVLSMGLGIQTSDMYLSHLHVIVFFTQAIHITSMWRPFKCIGL